LTFWDAGKISCWRKGFAPVCGEFWLISSVGAVWKNP
jgi:hypothetical protein